MNDSILIAEVGEVAKVTLNRPGRLNAMDESLIFGLQDYFRALHDRWSEPEVSTIYQ